MQADSNEIQVYIGEKDHLDTRSDGPLPPRRKLLEKARLWPFAIGAALVLIAIALEYGIALQKSAAIANKEVPGLPAAMASVIFTSKTVVLWIAEIGYAFFIGGVISSFMEVNARRELNEEVRRSREDIERDVVSHLYGIKHSQEYVRAVIGNCLESAIVREAYDVTYDIKPFPQQLAQAAGVDQKRFALVEVTLRYNARNLSGESGRFITGYGIPHRNAELLKEHSRLTRLEVGKKKYSPDEISRLEANHTHGAIDERIYQFEIKLETNESAEIIIEAQIVKELSDNDAFGFRRPTTGAIIKINDRIGNMIYGVTPRTSALLATKKEGRPGGGGEWHLQGPILPYDGITIWWRTPEDDGTPEAEEAVERSVQVGEGGGASSPKVASGDNHSNEPKSG